MNTNDKFSKVPQGSVWSKVQSIDLSPIRARLTVKKGWSAERVDKAIKQYLMFLYCCVAYPGANLQPTADVDEVWHDHILHLKKYIEDCQTICGRILYHEPFPVKSEQGKEQLTGCITVSRTDCSGTTGCQEAPPPDCALNSLTQTKRRAKPSFAALTLKHFGESVSEN